MSDRKGIGGRPRHGETAKVAYFNMRTTPELRARVEASRRVHGTASLVQEIERLVCAALDAQESSSSELV
jgi:hypothetical protein